MCTYIHIYIYIYIYIYTYPICGAVPEQIGHPTPRRSPNNSSLAVIQIYKYQMSSSQLNIEITTSKFQMFK